MSELEKLLILKFAIQKYIENHFCNCWDDCECGMLDVQLALKELDD